MKKQRQFNVIKAGTTPPAVIPAIKPKKPIVLKVAPAQTPVVAPPAPPVDLIPLLRSVGGTLAAIPGGLAWAKNEQGLDILSLLKRPVFEAGEDLLLNGLVEMLRDKTKEQIAAMITPRRPAGQPTVQPPAVGGIRHSMQTRQENQNEDPKRALDEDLTSFSSVRPVSWRKARRQG